MRAIACSRRHFRQLVTLPTLASILPLLLMLLKPCSAGALPDDVRARMLSSGVVEPQVVEALATQPGARVIISFAIDKAGDAAADQTDARRAIHAAGQVLLDSLAPGDFDVRRRYTALNALAGYATADGVLRLLDNRTITHVGVDHIVNAQLREAVPLVHLDDVQNIWLHRQGGDCGGARHGHRYRSPGSARQPRRRAMLLSTLRIPCCPDGTSRQDGTAGSAEDDDGHGTNVSGIITSNGSIAPTGCAPMPKLLLVRVLGPDGRWAYVGSSLPSIGSSRSAQTSRS